LFVRVPGGGVLIDWTKTRFLGLRPADWAEALEVTNRPVHRPPAPIVEELRRKRYLASAAVAPSSRDVALWLGGVNVLIRALGFGRALRVAGVLAPPYNRRDTGDQAVVEQLKRAIEGAGRRSWLVSSDCKTEALTAFILARRMGLDARLCVGMREHPLGAHSWTECCGVDIPKRDPRGYEFPVVLTVTL
jgi:hypothetical protein